MKGHQVLIVDGEAHGRCSIARHVEAAGLEPREAGDLASALEYASRVDAVVLDSSVWRPNGFDLLGRLRSATPHAPIVVLAAKPSVEQAVKAMRTGAYDYIGKPCDLDDLVTVLTEAIGMNQPAESGRLLGDSAAMQRVRSMTRRIAASPSSTVLITGESGTGKSLVARTIHDQSQRRDGPFVTITCSAIPEALLESELFGHERGAFTGAERQHSGLLEQAEGGTLLLDEVGEMPLAMQAKLLGVLESRAFRRVGGMEERRSDVRVVAATNVELEEAVRGGRFREDLYYRLNVVKLHIPPLRQRRDDIEQLGERFVEELSAELGVTKKRLRAEALDMLRLRPWLGNVRQLRNEIERALLLSTGPDLGPEDFIEPDSSLEATDSAFVLPADGVNLEELERALLEQALVRSGGNQRVAGEMLGMNRDQVRYRMAKYDIPRSRLAHRRS